MTSKRKREADVERDSRSGRRRIRSRSEPTMHLGESRSKRRRTERVSIDMDNQPTLDDEADDLRNEEVLDDEHEDPLLDMVPVDMDPEQLGFFVCAQETLRFLNRRGITPHHPMFAKLRSRLLRGIDEMSVA